MCYTVHHLVVFLCRANRDHRTTYEYLPLSGRRCVETYRDARNVKQERLVRAAHKCKKPTRFREHKEERVPARLFPPGWCPQKGCGGKGMPGKILKPDKHAKIKWDKVVEIDVSKKSTAADVWKEALDGTGEFDDDADSELSSSSQAPSSAVTGAPSSALSGYSEITDSATGDEDENEDGSESDDSQGTATGRRSPGSLTESEAAYVESSRREKREKEQRRLPRDRSSDKPGRHPAQRSLAIRPNSSEAGDSIPWPDLGLIGEIIAEEYRPDKGKDKGKGKAVKKTGRPPLLSRNQYKERLADVKDFDWRYNELRIGDARGDLHALAQQESTGSMGPMDDEADSQADGSLDLEGENIEKFEETYRGFRAERSEIEGYWLYCQRMVAELFAAAFPEDWPEEPVEQHIQTTRLLDQVQDPSSELSRVLYGAAAEAQLEGCDLSVHEFEDDEIKEEDDEQTKSSKKNSKLSIIEEEASEVMSEVSVASAQDSLDRGGVVYSSKRGPSRIMKQWLEALDRYRPEFDEAMRRQFSECRSDAERKELVFLLTRVAPHAAVLEHVTRAILNPNYSEHAQPGTRGEKSLQTFTDPEGRRGRAKAMRNAQLDGLGREGDRPNQWNQNPLDSQGRETFWRG